MFSFSTYCWDGSNWELSGAPPSLIAGQCRPEQCGVNGVSKVPGEWRWVEPKLVGGEQYQSCQPSRPDVPQPATSHGVTGWSGASRALQSYESVHSRTPHQADRPSLRILNGNISIIFLISVWSARSNELNQFWSSWHWLSPVIDGNWNGLWQL